MNVSPDELVASMRASCTRGPWLHSRRRLHWSACTLRRDAILNRKRNNRRTLAAKTTTNGDGVHCAGHIITQLKQNLCDKSYWSTGIVENDVYL